MKKIDRIASRHCKPHPNAPHGFMRNASHSEGRYVCECESWKPELIKLVAESKCKL